MQRTASALFGEIAIELLSDDGVGFEFRLVEQPTVCHHQLNMAQRAQIVKGIVLCDNQVGAEPRRNRARHIAEPGKLRGV